MTLRPEGAHPGKTKAPAASVNWRNESRHQGLGTTIDVTALHAGAQSSILAAPTPSFGAAARHPHVDAERVLQRRKCRDVAPRLPLQDPCHGRWCDTCPVGDAACGFARVVDAVTQSTAHRLDTRHVWGCVYREGRVRPLARLNVAGGARRPFGTHRPHFARYFGVVSAALFNRAHVQRVRGVR